MCIYTYIRIQKYRFHEIPFSLKEKELKKYKRYLTNLRDYLRDFFKRTQPLTDFSVVEQ